MNYWGAYNTNLSETVPPLVDFLDSMRPSGRKSAEAYYGIKSDRSAGQLPAGISTGAGLQRL